MALVPQDMSIIQYVLLLTLPGKFVEITSGTGDYEEIKTIQKSPLIDEVTIETVEGSKKTMSLDKIYSFLVEVKKPRIKPDGQIKERKRFRD